MVELAKLRTLSTWIARIELSDSMEWTYMALSEKVVEKPTKLSFLFMC